MVKIKKLQDSLRPLSHKITILNLQRSPTLSSFSVKKLVRLLLKAYQVRCEEIAIYFVSRPKIQALHNQFFQDPTATDCITLPYNSPDEPADFLGEIFICPEVACTYAKQHDLDPYREVALYLIHGFLHLMGFEDETTEQKQRMQQEEAKWIDQLSQLNFSSALH